MADNQDQIAALTQYGINTSGGDPTSGMPSNGTTPMPSQQNQDPLGLGFTGYIYDPTPVVNDDYDPDRVFADITRDKFKFYEDIYSDFEDDLLDRYGNEETVRREVDMAGEYVDESFDRTRAGANTKRMNYGVQLTPQQKYAADRLSNLNRIGAKVDTKNLSRESIDERRAQIRHSLIALGRGLADVATQGAGAASAEQQRINAANANIAAQEDASNTAAVATVAAAAIMAFSSRDFKEDIVPAPSKEMHDLVLATPINTFVYKDDDKRQVFIGPIAEDSPDQITTADKRMVNLYNMVGALFAAVQHQAAEIERLKTKGAES